jgi:hypothetical protein
MKVHREKGLVHTSRVVKKRTRRQKSRNRSDWRPGIWDAGDDDYIIPPRSWLLGNIFCRKFLSSLIADGGVGKTALRIAQLLSLATGRSFTGEHVFLRCRVLIVGLEDGKDELRRRVHAVMLKHSIRPKDVKGWLFLGRVDGIPAMHF